MKDYLDRAVGNISNFIYVLSIIISEFTIAICALLIGYGLLAHNNGVGVIGYIACAALGLVVIVIAGLYLTYNAVSIFILLRGIYRS